MTRALSGRLHAMAKAHAIVQRKASAIGGDTQLDLGSLIASIVKVHEHGKGPPRVTMDGEPIACGAQSVNALALLIHELATNAAKYGALASEHGHVEISWRSDGDHVVIDWRERGGSLLTCPPNRKGFGTTLIARTVERQFRGTIRYDWAAEGLSVSLHIPAESLAQ
jgi:two-component sensor histidine kinase